MSKDEKREKKVKTTKLSKSIIYDENSSSMNVRKPLVRWVISRACSSCQIFTVARKNKFDNEQAKEELADSSNVLATQRVSVEEKKSLCVDF